MIKLTNRTILRQAKCYQSVANRTLRSTAIQLAKNDASTIDSFKLPSQTSINEWEFKYDFIPKVASPKVPPVTPEAVKQDIAQDKRASVEREMFTKEANSSIKVEANLASVVHGGESVEPSHELLEDRGSEPVDVVNKFSNKTEPKKTANQDKYIQTSINPNINKGDVVNLSENEVEHEDTIVKEQTPVVEDIEHDNLTGQGQGSQKQQSSSSSTNPLVWVGAFALGWGGYSFYSSSTKKNN